MRSTSPFESIFTLTPLAPRHKKDVPVIQHGNDIIPVCELDNSRVVCVLCSNKHVVLDCLQQGRDDGGHRRKAASRLLAGVSSDGDIFSLGDIPRSDLNPYGNALIVSNLLV